MNITEEKSNLSESDLEEIEDGLFAKTVTACLGISIMYYYTFNSLIFSIGIFLALLGFITLFIQLYIIDKQYIGDYDG